MADRELGVILKQATPIHMDVGFTCAPGQVLALFGPSGSGKTTILRSIAGLYSPQVGRITMGSDTWLDAAAGVDVPVHRRQVGFVSQDYALFPHLTALGNVMTALTHRVREERRTRALEFLKLVHLEDRGDRRPSALSGGERQRVAVARALAREPRVLLLDEPFAAVDRSLRRTLHGEIDDIRRSFDIPIVLVTHDFDDVVRLATHLVILKAGSILASGPIESLTSRPDLPWLRETVGLGTVIDAAVVRVDPSRGLAEIDIGGIILVTSIAGHSIGRRVRVRIPAREVILATEAPRGLSVHNVLFGAVTSVSADGVSDVAIVQLAVGHTHLLAEVTRDAVHRLRIAEGVELHALIKSVSLEVLGTGPDVERESAMKVSVPSSQMPMSHTRRLILASIFGAVIAVVGGLIGLGGAEFRLPVLIGVFAMAARRAIGLNLLISLVTVATALATRTLSGAFMPAWEWRLAVLSLTAGGMVGAGLGVRVAGRLHDDGLERVIAGLLIGIAALLGIEAAVGDALVGPLATTATVVIVLGLMLGVVIGAVSSLLGVAGGELLIPTFVFVFGADIKTAGTASLLVSLPTVAVGVLRYRTHGAYKTQDSLRDVGVPMAAGSIVGAAIGGRLVSWVDVPVLKAILALVLAVSAVRMWRGRSTQTSSS